MAPEANFDERLQASAVRFLIEGKEEVAARVLLSCTLEHWVRESYGWNNDGCEDITIKLSGPREAYDILTDIKNPIRESIEYALNACSPENWSIYLLVKASLIDIDTNYRNELLEIARGRGISNQAGSQTTQILNWNNLGFRSASEIKIAKALDNAGVMFFPNCKVRLGAIGTRSNREPDFLICHNGKWGILEVDGEPFHPASRTVADHERDRQFKLHGITVTEHYDATRCYNEPDAVIGEFLNILDRSVR
jgi:hypothetical protein